ncbi:MAG: Na(+)/H(+) antiporter subunit B [Candidatus Krumholzibacteria bacterium]|nr:Na(+)/H(+) antiporter subunit B [Candidatus Krumholzibacteria bacterium]
MIEHARPFDLAAERCEPSSSPIIRIASRGLAPLIQIIGLYVFFHGHYSPGGGFQGGVLLAASIILLRMGLGFANTQTVMPSGWTVPLGAVGGLIYIGTGFFAVLCGGNFLDYGVFPMPWLDPPHLHSYGILFIEVGVTLTVMSTLVAIFDHLLDG